jgi:signal transduction histidine kinase
LLYELLTFISKKTQIVLSIYLQATIDIQFTDTRSLLLGVFYGLMIIMAIYNFLLYLSLKDRAYILYVGATVFAILTTVATNNLGYQYLWPNSPDLDGIIYVTFAGLSMFCSSRFTAVFLQVNQFDKKVNQFLWLIAGLSLFLSILSLFLAIEHITQFGRWLVLIAFPSYIAIGIHAYRKGFKPALFYVIAWIPYVLGLVTRTLHGAELLPTNLLTLSSLEIGGALEITLLSFALADRIRSMRKELLEKELEKEQFKTKLLEDQKVFLERKVEERTKELKEANAAKDKFFSIIAHDLRSPMIALQGVGQKLEYFIKKDKQEKLLEMGGKIDQSIDQLNHLLNNLLNWAASETGSIPKNPTNIDLKELVVENIVLYNSLAKTKSVKIVDETTSQLAYADANMVSTIIRNLLSNAIKFTPKGGKVIIRDYQNARQLGLSIKDEGPGMDTEQIAVLGSGELASATGSNNEKGFGLGLKLCREFVELNFGVMDIQSEKGKGSVFSFVLPREAKSILRDINAV